MIKQASKNTVVIFIALNLKLNIKTECLKVLFRWRIFVCLVFPS